MRKLAIILPLLAGFAAAPAHAQNLGLTGRAEVRGGYDEVRADIRFQNSLLADDFGVGDVMFGAEAGADARISQGVQVGVYGGVDFSQVDGCEENPFVNRVRERDRQDRVCVDAGRNIYAGARVGVPMGNGGLIYGKGGFSEGRFSGSYTVTRVPQNSGQRVGEFFSGRDTVSGYHFGGGFELGISSNFYVKGEYVQHRYKDAFRNLLNRDTTNPNPLSRTDEFDPHRHQILLGFGIRG
ncbi:MAG TPA: outer membrane beta-barrel protein [Allosphingosinicella sp.]|nr:outer membrane beta-barrel protein [Allosphingosinicella sp.]